MAMSDIFGKDIVRALERIAVVLEERLPLLSEANEVERLNAVCDSLKNEMQRIAAERDQLRASAPDLGVGCRDCGKTITGMSTVAGSVCCLECNRKRVGK
jgi:hypothetical protein